MESLRRLHWLILLFYMVCIYSLLVLQVLLVLLVLVLSLLMELLLLWFTKLMESRESDSELEELQDEPHPMKLLLHSGLNLLTFNFIFNYIV